MSVETKFNQHTQHHQQWSACVLPNLKNTNTHTFITLHNNILVCLFKTFLWGSNMLILTKSFTPGGSHHWITYTYSQRLTVQSFKSRTPLRYQNISIFAQCTRLQFEHQQYRYLTPKNHTLTYNSNIKYKLSNIVANLILRGTAKPYQTHSRQFYRTVLTQHHSVEHVESNHTKRFRLLIRINFRSPFLQIPKHPNLNLSTHNVRIPY